MATRREPRFKLSRRLGVNICGHPNAMKRATKENSRSGKKLSNYGLQLLEKQKLKAYYNILERQFVRYVKDAIKSKENTGEALLKSLECRLDNLVYKLGFASSIRQARQMVNHGHILVNGKKIDIPSYGVKVGEEISLREKSIKNRGFMENFQELIKFQLPYLEKDWNNFKGKLVKVPTMEQIAVEVNIISVVEFYSK